MRDINRIHGFCSELAALWEKSPDLRFGQIITALPQYIENRPADLFYLEEDQMLSVLRRFFDRQQSAKASTVRNEERNQLEDKWDDLLNALRFEHSFDVEAYKELFQETWRYLMEYASDRYIGSKDISIISSLASFAYCIDGSYPSGVTYWEYDACIKLAEGLLDTVKNPEGRYLGSFHNGIIVIEVFHNDYSEVKLDQFEAFFRELSDTYHDDSYSDE